MGRRAESAHFARNSSGTTSGGTSVHSGTESRKKKKKKKRNQSADIIKHRQRLRRAALLQRPPSRQRSPFPTHLAEFEFKRFHAFGDKPGGGHIGAMMMNKEQIKARKMAEESPRPPSRHKPPAQNLFLKVTPAERKTAAGEGNSATHSAGNSATTTGLATASTKTGEGKQIQEADEVSEVVEGSGRHVTNQQHHALFMSTTVAGSSGGGGGGGVGGVNSGSQHLNNQNLYDLTLEPPREHAIPIQITTRTRDGGHAITTTTTLEVAKLHMQKLATEHAKRQQKILDRQKKKEKAQRTQSSKNGEKKEGKEEQKEQKEQEPQQAPQQEQKEMGQEQPSQKVSESGGSSSRKKKKKKNTEQNALKLNLETMTRQPSVASLESARYQRQAEEEYQQALLSSRTTPRRMFYDEEDDESHTARSGRNNGGSGNSSKPSRQGSKGSKGSKGSQYVPSPPDSQQQRGRDWTNASGKGDQGLDQEYEEDHHRRRARTADIGEVKHMMEDEVMAEQNGGIHPGSGYRPPLTAYADVPEPKSEKEKEREQERKNRKERKKGKKGKEKRKRKKRGKQYREVDDADTELREWERQMMNSREGGGSRGGTADTNDTNDTNDTVSSGERSQERSQQRSTRGGGEGWFEELFGGRDEGGRASDVSSDASSLEGGHNDSSYRQYPPYEGGRISDGASSSTSWNSDEIIEEEQNDESSR